jgi:two-component system, cell cycle sensor histidine kinase and response regulator CckA
VRLRPNVDFETYGKALRAYLAGDTEAALERAYEIGRAALAIGLGVVDLAALHRQVSLEGILTTEESVAAREQVDRGWKFFTEVLAPYEMTLRGFKEANLKLHHIASTLEQHVQDRTQDLRESERRYRLLFESSPLPMWVYDTGSFAFLAVNDAAARHYGYTRDEFLRMTIKDIRPAEDVPPLVDHVAHLPEPDSKETWRHCKKDGTRIDVEISAHAFEFAGRPARLVLVNDVTERKRLEEQLRQAQKMEAIGRLAGGVAHDFNNMMSVVMSYSSMLIQEFPPGDQKREDLEEIRKAGERAAALTRQLLAFSRQQVLEPRILDLNEVLGNVDKMLRRLIGEDVELVTLPAKGLRSVKADPGQIEQVLMNLAVNARDAMPNGGRLTIETANLDVDAGYSREHFDAKPGPYVMLAVSDTGVGMDKATQARIFEPFFTTKEVGKGTGLGLATVFGIVKQSGGTIWVYSEPGRGTTFKVYLPQVDEAGRLVTTRPVSGSASHGTETILLVEDEEQVRHLVRTILHQHGYLTLVARDPAEALHLSDTHPGAIDLLLTDVVMPQMSGRQLAEQLSPRRPTMKVLYMSGYTDDAVVRSGVLQAEVAFVQKPLTPDTLAQKVRQALDFNSPS